MNIPFDSPMASDINSRIAEHMYFAALEQSCELAKVDGPYQTFKGSPASNGILQFHLWDQEDKEFAARYAQKGEEGQKQQQQHQRIGKTHLTIEMDKWDELIDKIKKFGLRNSLLVAPMPTVSTSQMLGNAECFEPFYSNMYGGRTLSGEFLIVNKYLVRKLASLGLWNETMRQRIIAENGSVQNILEIPQEVREVFKTAFEIKQKVLMNLAVARGRFVCQSQSFSLFFTNPNPQILSSAFMYAWKEGLKTGMYYLRTKAAADPIKFTLTINNPDTSSTNTSTSTTATASSCIRKSKTNKSSSPSSSTSEEDKNDEYSCESCSA